ncbi:MAG: zinc ABC transporter substrate-binding protein [Actinomycetia bacterium]|nr:zinc ABC transporter substrate-binding protein [Actinomycetes bacterium]
MPPGRCFQNLSVLVALLLAGCGSGTGTASGDNQPLVVVTTSIWADVVANIGCGQFRIETLLPGGADPHAFEPSLSDRRDLDEAAAVVANGLGLEGPLEDSLAATEQAGTPVVRAGEYAVANAGTAIEGANPHVWFDPRLMGSILADVAGQIAAATGVDYVDLIDCVEAYELELGALDEEIARLLAGVPADHRHLVSSHDFLPWFADRYDLEVVGAVVGSASTLAQARPAQLEELAATMSDLDVGAVFTEVGESSPDTEALAARMGGVVVAPLYTESLGPDGSGADSYVGLMSTNARRVAQALA